MNENSRITCIDFIENKATFGYLISLLTVSYWWDKEACLQDIFLGLQNSEISKSDIMAKLQNIRILRNKISHYSRIIGKYQIIRFNNSDGVSLSDVYKDLLDIYSLLDISLPDDENDSINKNFLCNLNAFSDLYNKYSFIHDYEIVPAKSEKTYAIPMIAVNSSYFCEYGYDAKEKVFQVKFNGGEIYQYYHVPSKLFDNLKQAKSKGKYFIANIRENFQYKKIN